MSVSETTTLVEAVLDDIIVDMIDNIARQPMTISLFLPHSTYFTLPI